MSKFKFFKIPSSSEILIESKINNVLPIEEEIINML